MSDLACNILGGSLGCDVAAPRQGDGEPCMAVVFRLNAKMEFSTSDSGKPYALRRKVRAIL